MPESSGAWPITETPNTVIDDIPTVKDFVPLDTLYKLTEDNVIVYKSDDPAWGLNCFILVAMGNTSDGHFIAYQGRLPFTGQAPHTVRISIDGQYYFGPKFGRKLYFDNGSKFNYPTVYVYGKLDNTIYIEYLSYNEKAREWIHVIKPVKSSEGFILEMRCKALGIPFWMGKFDGPYIVHGVYRNIRDLDIWAGFWDVGVFEANLTIPELGSYQFEGFFLFDRAVHRTYFGNPYPSGAPVSFSCIAIFDENFILTISNSTNPTKENFPKFQHQGRINLLKFNVSFPLDKFKFTDDGRIQPSEFTLNGEFQGGYFNLTGRAFAYWPPKQWMVTSRGTWWDNEVTCVWGRAFIKWTGKIVYNGEEIPVNAIGIGEFTRAKKSMETMSVIADHDYSLLFMIKCEEVVVDEI